jgi:pimeloyl-ACP methyl ester carboxylesterase
MDERFQDVGKVTLCYDTFGSESDPPMLLVMGLGTQMLAWREELCEQLAARGFFVVRYDNRDCGRSTWLDEQRPPSTFELLTRRKLPAAYDLDDMAGDAAGLLEALGLRPAHVVGASMGGMIAQNLAALHPRRVRSLTSIMSTTGGRFVGQPALRTYPVLMRRGPEGEEAFVEHVVKLQATIGSPGFPREDEEIRDLARRFHRRGLTAGGTARQLGAIVASGDRTNLLRRIVAPTLVIHGTADKLVRPSGGRATAEAIPGARLLEIEGMAHDLPKPAWPRIVDAIVANANRAGVAAAA